MTLLENGIRSGLGAEGDACGGGDACGPGGWGVQGGLRMSSALLRCMGPVALSAFQSVVTTSNGQESLVPSERSQLMPQASAYQESAEGHARPTEPGEK